jgi:prepilin-type N-terminal cleavage/methylation domain-containing protein
MRGRSADAAGFSLVEVVIAMFLLGIIAVALLPALWQGIEMSAEQSSTATATRYMNSIVNDARDNPDCTYLGAIAARPAVEDGRDVAMTTTSTTVSGCAKGSTAKLLVMVMGEGRILATTTALIFIP